MGNTPRSEPTGPEAQALLKKAREAGHLPEGFVEKELAAMRKETGNKLLAAGSVEREDTKRELSPEAQRRLLAILKSRFERNQKILHPKTQWTHVEKSLQARPDLMWSLQQLEATGGEPDVIQDVEGAYIFGDCSAESPIGRRNCMYDRAAETRFSFFEAAGSLNGNAVDLAVSFGADLMDKDQYFALQRLIALDSNTSSWLKTPADVRESSYGLLGNRVGYDVNVFRFSADMHDDDKGFRAVLRVPKVKA